MNSSRFVPGDPRAVTVGRQGGLSRRDTSKELRRFYCTEAMVESFLRDLPQRITRSQFKARLTEFAKRVLLAGQNRQRRVQQGLLKKGRAA